MGAVRIGALAGLLLSSCGTTGLTVLSTGPDADGGAGEGGLATNAADANGANATYCQKAVPASLVSTAASGTPVCPGKMAASAFRFALCSCGDLAWGQPLTTDAFDGSNGPYSATATTVGASVGANGSIQSGGALQIGGSLWNGGSSPGLSSAFQATLAGELHAAGLVNLTGPGLTVGTDAWTANGLTVSGNLLVPGALHIPAGAPLTVGGTKTIGTLVTEPVQVPLPCDCAAGDVVDVGGFVETYRAANDDALTGLDDQLLENVAEPLTQTLPCGRLFFTKVGAHAPVHLTVAGRTAVFIGGDFIADDDFVVDVPPGSQLDLFIEGNVLASQGFAVGDPENPALARVYVGGSGDLDFASATSITGNFYAPAAQLVLGAAGVTIFGSAFVRQLGTANGGLTIHFDESIARAGSTCTAPASCASCSDCDNQACENGACGSCSDSSQCCAPLVCRSGTCVLDVR